MLLHALFALALAAGYVHAQPAPGEVAFWESVRDSKNPDELRAYLQTFPNGMFAPLARTRLAALDKGAPSSAPKPAAPPSAAPRPAPAVASTAPASVTPATRMPQAGDTWTYKLSYPRIRGQWGQESRPPSNYVVKVGGVNEGKITDQLTIDGGTVSELSHFREPTLGPQGVSLFSPYLVVQQDLKARSSLGRVTIQDPGCGGMRQVCEASARVIGQEAVQTPAGTFTATKVLVEQTWRSSGNISSGSVAGMMGGRRLAIWYVPELKRAVKFESRLTVGDVPPVDSNFDLELVSYQVK